MLAVYITKIIRSPNALRKKLSRRNTHVRFKGRTAAATMVDAR